MIKLNDEEYNFLIEFANKKNSVVRYTIDNKIVIDDKVEDSDKYSYHPYPEFSTDLLEKAKQKGLGQVMKDFFYIQKKLSESKTDRFRQLPSLVFGRDQEDNLYFYEKGVGNVNKKVNLFNIIRISQKRRVETELGNHYHVYSFFNALSKGRLNDKNYSLKVLEHLLNDPKDSLGLIDSFCFLLKGLMITSAVTPDVVITMKSSKPINKMITDKLKSNDFFKDTKFVEISKPSYKKLEVFYYSNSYKFKAFNHPDLKEKLEKMKESDTISMKEFSLEHRRNFSTIIKDYLKEKSNIKQYTDKNIVIIDDTITTSSTFKNILFPLVDGISKKVMPFTLITR